MKLTTRPYGGKIFRPQPEVYISDDHSLLIIATPWGDSQIAKDFITTVTSSWQDGLRDPDKTYAYTPDDGLSSAEHLLKMAILTAHEDLKDKYNDEKLSAGLEILCLLKNQQKLSWFQVGAPSLILVRDQSLMPLFHAVDFSYDFSTLEKTLAPLPKNLLGVQQHVHLGIGGIKIHSNDRFMMVSRSYISSDFFKSLNCENITLDSTAHLLAVENENQPFWLGLLLMD